MPASMRPPGEAGGNGRKQRRPGVRRQGFNEAAGGSRRKQQRADKHWSPLIGLQ